MDIYAHNILDHYKNPRNFGSFPEADSFSRSLNSSCGDEITAFLKLNGDLVEKITFTGHGCAIAMAASSILSEALLGENIKEVLAMDLSAVQAKLGIKISPRRHKCALIGLLSIQAAIYDILDKKK